MPPFGFRQPKTLRRSRSKAHHRPRSHARGLQFPLLKSYKANHFRRWGPGEPCQQLHTNGCPQCPHFYYRLTRDPEDQGANMRKARFPASYGRCERGSRVSHDGGQVWLSGVRRQKVGVRTSMRHGGRRTSDYLTAGRVMPRIPRLRFDLQRRLVRE